MDISAWLRDLGLGQYEQAFRENDIDAEVVADLTADDLSGLGITSIGHRRKLLAAIAALRAGLVPAPSPPAVAPTAVSGTALPFPEAERRQLTVMFVDLVGSTALASRLDPEDMREVIGSYHRCVAEAVGRLGGFVAKYMGDGVLVYFGWPHGDETDAERAVRAALAALQAVAQAAPAGERLAARIGIATGLAVVGDLLGAGAAQEQTVIGETPNIAARLQSRATPGCAVIDAETRRRIGGMFECRELGALNLKGLSGRVGAWQVLGEAAVQSRFEAMHTASLAPLVGRDDELDLLLRRWRHAKDGEGQVVLISGEPGIGKSRLIAALEERVAGEAHLKLKYFCSPHQHDSALQPIIARWRNEAGFVRGEPADVRLDKLEALLLPLGATAEELTLIAEMLGVPGGERYPPLALGPERKKEQTFRALQQILDERARRSPLLMLFEDAHWADPSSLELFDRLIMRLASLPALVVISFRPEFQAPWVGQSGVILIALSRLSDRQAAMLASQVVVGQTLPIGMLERIVAETDGVPLFIEELTKAVLEGASQPGVLDSALPVPSTLQGSLMARLDRLPVAKQVAQTGAVIGREFGHELLAAVAGLPDVALAQGLDELLSCGLAFRRGTPPEATYSFKHALVQDAAYASLLRSTQRKLHARIATVLEERWSEAVETQPELLAHHFTQAGLAERAAEYWQLAGEHAFRHSAAAEAIGHLTKSIDLVRSLPESGAQAERELHLQTMLGQACIARYGYAAPETAAAFARARDLVEAVGDIRQQFPVLYGYWAVQYVRMALREQNALAEQTLALAEQHRDPERLCVAHRVCGATNEMMGELLVAREHLEQAVELYDRERHGSTAFTFGQDLGVAALSHLNWVLWLLGYPDQAAGRQADALSLAHRVGHKNTLGFALMYSAMASAYGRTAGSAAEHSEALLELAREQKFDLWTAGATVVKGWAIARQGQAAAGVAAIQSGLAQWTSSGAEWMRPFFLGLLGEACALSGDVRRGLGALDEALAADERTGQCWPDAELHRLRGQLVAVLPDGGRPDEAIAAFQRAIQIARRQSAKSWELRAATDLARLWRHQGKHAEASDLLAPVHAWFSEGFETPDVQEAKALLDVLR
ncbi:MAG: adenylate cyclase [Mesorhizobium sp.]|uniref:AAA family ATPase n=1 Tax=unclassified Mesorhizobium TaxID=325217 RepID=UPI000FCA8503|nr:MULTISPECIES: AAA family ATPase [unclassified Mesorhizobium]RUV72731.1 adenylate cyclase [Mesorhizobium sp. M5C.F.Cr.IN.023.01.1.1]RWF90490.1 MAG: adenylate cyclase [Mesorhizobium sp.]RWF96811.1 MAG: adenylate cyclase [Mesorhizobium sp.]RWI41741.1 MAG: adenylate cyclase [Mesorhizobium sp.]RWI50902.1 MAG: adenylate cyclase [Mesorhizobium sp.]